MRGIIRTTKYLLFWILIAVAVALSCIRILIADAGHYKSELERKILAFTGIPLHIGALRATMNGFNPTLILRDMHIDAAESAIELQEAHISVNLFQLVWTADLLKSGALTLIGAKFDLLRNLDGDIVIKGLKNSSGSLAWLLSGGKYQILHSDVSWRDLKNNIQPVYFHNVDLLLKNHLQDHEIHVLTDLPAPYGESMRVSALLTDDVFDLRRLDGKLYLEGVNLQSLLVAGQKLPLGLRLESGLGNIRVWSDWRQGELTRVIAYVQAQQVKIVTSANKTLQLDNLQTNLSWLTTKNGWRFGAYDVDIVANQKHWLDGEFYWRQDQSGNIAGFIKQLDLSVPAIFISTLNPLDNQSEFRQVDGLLHNFTGLLNDFSFYIESDWRQYAMQGRFSRLGFVGSKSMPGIQGLTGQISGTNRQGQIVLQSDRDLLIDAPELFRNPVTVKALRGGIDWRQNSGDWLLSSRELRIDSPDFQLLGNFDLTIPKNEFSSKLNLIAHLNNFSDISKISTYLPAKVMSKDAVSWLDQAFLSGRIDQGEIIIQGSLEEFPFANGDGRFDVLLGLENVEIEYNPYWPHVKNLSADIHLSGADLRVAVFGGNKDNVEIRQALITIPDFLDNSEVEIKGVLQSRIESALLFLQQTPLRNRVDPILKALSFEGDTQLNLDLKLPYDESGPLHVDVVSELNNVSLKVKPLNLNINDVSGSINFTETKVRGAGLTANMLNFPIQAALTGESGVARLKITGAANTDDLQRQFNFLKNDFINGAFTYQAEAILPIASDQASSFLFSSNLQGVAIDNLAGLSKNAEYAVPFKLNFQFADKAMSPLYVSYGDELKAAFLVNLEQKSLFAGHVVFGKSEADMPKDAGLFIEISQPEFQLSNGLMDLSSTDSPWPPLREVQLETKKLIWQGQNLGAATCHFQHMNQVWQGSVSHSLAAGRLSIPDRFADNERIKMDMDYLNLSAMNSLNLNLEEQAFTVLPLIDIDSRQVFWRAVNLGKLKLQTERLNNGVHFKKILITGVNNEFNFTADWLKQLHGTSTLIDGAMKVNNFGQFLSELGYGDDFKETQADFNFTGGWNDAPQQFSLDKLSGQLQIKLSDGRISSIEPGFGRLLGLISLEQWAKRLSLDFSDIYREGLAFNRITGDVNITNGIAFTDNLLIDAVAAKMRIAGTTDLVNRTFNQRVTVIPKSSDALPIAGTIVNSIAAFITDAVTDDYKEGYFFGSEYKVSGRWGDIEVTPLNDRDGLVNKTWHGLTNFDWLKK
jgi:uncharacterized protein (TIGR02099 family)